MIRMQYKLLLATLLLSFGASVEARDFTASECPAIGNTESLIYHVKGCPNFPQMLEMNKNGENRKCFRNRSSAEKAGYQISKNCRKEVYLRRSD